MAKGQDVATRGDNLPDTIDGLEDIGAGDVLLPVIKIDHPAGEFVDSLSNERFTEFDAILLGAIKNRVLWPSEVGEEGQMPLCRSLDFNHGRPTEEFKEKDPSKQVPANVSGFSKKVTLDAIAEAELGPSADLDKLLPCANCQLKEWETMPGAKTPWCSEQLIFPVLRIVREENEDGDVEERFQPAYITFQRASLKPCRAYISSFRQSQRPMYTVRTRVRAIHQKRGNVQFVTPEFSKGDPTESSRWAEYSENLHDIRAFLTTPRVRDTDNDTDDEPAEDDDEAIDTTAEEVEPAEDEDVPAEADDEADDDDDDDDEEPF